MLINVGINVIYENRFVVRITATIAITMRRGGGTDSGDDSNDDDDSVNNFKYSFRWIVDAIITF